MTADPLTGAPARRRPGLLRTALLAVIAVGLVVLGGALAVGLDLGRSGTDVPGEESVDAGFSRDMATHHVQGVEMANLALERSTDPAVRGLAFDIAETQNNQVGRMRGWLSLWDLTPTGSGGHMAWMGGGHAGHHDSSGSDGALMPGMATEDELAELRSLSGTEFDVEFLRLMTRHHQGGFDMAEYAAAHAAVPAVRSLARSIADGQSAEVQLMVRMLTERGGTPLPAP